MITWCVFFSFHYRESLTSSQPQTRARGVQLLSEVLNRCHGNLTEREGTEGCCYGSVVNCCQRFLSLSVSHSCFARSSVPLLHSGSSYSFLWEQTEGPLCRHLVSPTGARSTGQRLPRPLCYLCPSYILFIEVHNITNIYVVLQSKCKMLPPGSAVSMLRSLFQDVHVQVRVSVGLKYNTYIRKILRNLFIKCNELFPFFFSLWCWQRDHVSITCSSIWWRPEKLVRALEPLKYFLIFFSTNLYLYYPEANLSEHCLMFTCPFCCVCSTAIISDYLGKGLHFLFKWN